MSNETLNKTKHTPGPWKIEGPNLNHKDQFRYAVYTNTEVKPKWICELEFYSDQGTETDKANAKLIAAAPDLLEACQWAVAFGKNGQSHDKMILSKLKEAIKKATI